MTRTITGLFDNRAEAEAVVQHLRTHDGIDPSRISVHGTEGTSAAPVAEDRGFWASLRDLFIPDEDRYSYSEGIRRGGTVVSAEVPDDLVEHALDIFEEHGAVDLEGREAEWRNAGWTSYQGDAVVGARPDVNAKGDAAAMVSETAMRDDAAGTGMPMNTSAAVGAATMGGTSTPAVGGTAPVAPGLTGATTASDLAAGTGRTEEDRIPIVEEQLRVGKREMDRGRVRVRSYVVETPVNESVTLRDERVEVERRPANLPISAVDDAFRERTIEAVEHAEEAVVSKEARVKEELVIRKQAEERTQTVSDTVRHTEVEVEDDRKAGAATTPVRPVDTTRTP